MAITATFAADFTGFVSSARTAERALVEVEGAAAKVIPRVEDLRSSLGRFDGVLSSVGVNIGSEVRGLGELSDASGKTFTELGLLTTAGLAFGAAVAGWKVGRLAADFFDLDEKIGNATAKLLGWGDAAGEAAGAQQDTINKAIADGAAATISYTDAIAYNTKRLTEKSDAVKLAAATTKALADADKVAADAMHASNERMLKDTQAQIDALKPFRAAMEELNSAGVGWQGTLDTIDGSVVEAIKHYLEAGVSQKALADAYGLTDAQVKSVGSSLRADADATRESAREHDRLADAANAAADALKREAEEAERLRKEAEKARVAIEALKKANREMGNSTQFDVSTEAGRMAIPEGIRTWLHDGYSLAQAAQIDFLMRWGLPINANDPLFRNKGPRVPGFAGGVENFAGGMAVVGERGPELLNLPAGSDVIPMSRSSSKGIVNNFYLVDNSENLARKTVQLILTSMKRGKQLGLA